MEHPRSEFLARTVRAIDSGDAQAASELVPFLYRELRQLAAALMRRLPPGQTLQPTALVHEAYVRLVGAEGSGWDGRGHFFGAAAQAMREILIQEARRKAALKRGGDRRRVELDSDALAIEPPGDDILALDEALRRLETEDPRAARVVLLRHFAGLTIPETAEVLGVSTGTVEREWRFARASLYDQLAGEPDGD